jgi:hypothetical protein
MFALSEGPTDVPFRGSDHEIDAGRTRRVTRPATVTWSPEAALWRDGSVAQRCLAPPAVSSNSSTKSKGITIDRSASMLPLSTSTGSRASPHASSRDGVGSVPLNWDIDTIRRWGRITVTDPYTHDECRHAIHELLERVPDLRSFRVLVTREEAATPSAGFIRDIIKLLEHHHDRMVGLLCATVASDDAAYGMARMAMILSDLRLPFVSFQVFRTEYDAQCWLEFGD